MSSNQNTYIITLMTYKLRVLICESIALREFIPISFQNLLDELEIHVSIMFNLTSDKMLVELMFGFYFFVFYTAKSHSNHQNSQYLYL